MEPNKTTPSFRNWLSFFLHTVPFYVLFITLMILAILEGLIIGTFSPNLSQEQFNYHLAIFIISAFIAAIREWIRSGINRGRALFYQDRKLWDKKKSKTCGKLLFGELIVFVGAFALFGIGVRSKQAEIDQVVFNDRYTLNFANDIAITSGLVEIVYIFSYLFTFQKETCCSRAEELEEYSMGVVFPYVIYKSRGGNAIQRRRELRSQIMAIFLSFMARVQMLGEFTIITLLSAFIAANGPSIESNRTYLIVLWMIILNFGSQFIRSHLLDDLFIEPSDDGAIPIIKYSLFLWYQLIQIANLITRAVFCGMAFYEFNTTGLDADKAGAVSKFLVTTFTLIFIIISAVEHLIWIIKGIHYNAQRKNVPAAERSAYSTTKWIESYLLRLR